MSDSFIETVITPEDETEDTEMIYRNFYGLEAVAQAEEEYATTNGGEE